MNLYLIAHKVRGELAYDIAHKMEVEGQDDSPWWIVTTSGHRAYPFNWWLLEDLTDTSDYPHSRPFEFEPTPLLFANVPDHYEVRASAKAKLTGLIDKLGLRKKLRIIVRPL